MIGVAMNIRVLFLSSLLLVAAPTLAREKTDVIVMNNGDRLSEEIKGIDAGVLYLSLDYVDGTISIQWSKVARLESIQRFIVRTQDGSCLAARSLQGDIFRSQIARKKWCSKGLESSSWMKLPRSSNRD